MKVKARFTSDAETNRKMISDDVLAFGDQLKDAFEGARLSAYFVEQNSEEAQKLSHALAEYERKRISDT